MSFGSATGASFLFFFCAAIPLDQVLGHFGCLPTWVQKFLVVLILSFPQMVPIGRQTWFPLNGLPPIRMATGLPLCVPSCHSIFPLHTSDRWMGPIDVCATMVSPKAHDIRPLSLPREIVLRRLWGPPLATTGCGLRCIHHFHQTQSLPLGTPGFFFLIFLLLVKCSTE